MEEHGRNSVRIPARQRSLDKIDLRIIEELQKNGRITKTELSKLVGLSPTPCNLRIERLEKMGIVQGYHAHIDFFRLANVSTFIAEIYIENYVENSREFEELVLQVPQITECIAVLGEIDYIIKVLAPTVQDYQSTINRLLAEGCGIVDYRTFAVSNHIKRETSLSISELIQLDGP